MIAHLPCPYCGVAVPALPKDAIQIHVRSACSKAPSDKASIPMLQINTEPVAPNRAQRPVVRGKAAKRERFNAERGALLRGQESPKQSTAQTNLAIRKLAKCRSCSRPITKGGDFCPMCS